ncbi:IBR domain-containing protein [Phlyctema vagabunda]|uniref:RBR-type E3 ubiquitin transferase n=1 Tax=Phlyctema vagabunda TaxID=108571 RepID=A0ABR4P2U7_9HELO
MQATGEPGPSRNAYDVHGNYLFDGADPTNRSEDEHSVESQMSYRTASTSLEQEYFDAIDPDTQVPYQGVNTIDFGSRQPPPGIHNGHISRTMQNNASLQPSNQTWRAHVPAEGELDYRKYPMPKELLQREDETSQEIRDLITSSVARLSEPEFTSSPLQHQVEEDITTITTSRNSGASNDSGYESMHAEPGASKSKTWKGFGGITTLFRRKGKRTSRPTPTATELSKSPQQPQNVESETVLATNTGSLSMASLNHMPASDAQYRLPKPPLLPVPLLTIEARAQHSLSRPSGSPPQVEQQSEPESLVAEQTIIECVSCLDDFALGEVRKLTCHSYCGPCFEALISASLSSESQWPPKCCLTPIPFPKILPYIPQEMAILLSLRTEEWGTPAGERIYCSRPTCAAWIAGKYVDGASRTATCQKCRKGTCTVCRGKSHRGEDCPDDPSLRATEALAKQEGWKRCYQCHAFVAQNTGCRHMTCRCKAEFCYVCGLKWRTCGCSEADLVAATALLNQRHRERQTAEAATAAVRDAELAVIAAREEAERRLIEEVEEYIRSENERLAQAAELERQEAAARAEEERQRLEAARLSSVHQLFGNYRLELTSLHDLQQILIAERQEFEDGLLKRDLENILDTLSLRHIAVSQLLQIESESLISDTQHRFDEEHRQRQAEERRLEAQYFDELRRYHHGHPDARKIIMQARLEYREEQDAQYKIWEECRRKELRDLVARETNKMAILMAKQASEIRDAREASAKQKSEWMTRCAADGKWVEEIIRLRETMLGEREQEEYGQQT